MKPKQPINKLKVTSVSLLRDKAEYLLKQHDGEMDKYELYHQISRESKKGFARPMRGFSKLLISDPKLRFSYENGRIRLRSEKEIQERVKANNVIHAQIGGK